MATVVPKNLTISNYREFLDVNPQQTFHQTVEANNVGQSITFQITSPSPTAVLDATKVKLRLKGFLRFQSNDGANVVSPKECNYAQAKSALKYNAVQNAISNITITINGASRTYPATEFSNIFEYITDPNYCGNERLEGGGASVISMLNPGHTSGSDNYFRGLEDVGFSGRERVLYLEMGANAPVDKNPVSFTQRLTMPPFWSGKRNELTAQMSNVIPHFGKAQIVVNFLPEAQLSTALIEVDTMEETKNRFDFAWKDGNASNKCELLLTWYEPSPTTVLPPLVRIPVWSANVNSTSFTLNQCVKNTTVTKGSDYLRLADSPKYLLFYAQLDRGNDNELTGYKAKSGTMANNVGTTAELFNWSACRDSLPLIKSLTLRINTDQGVLDTTIKEDQLYDLTMENCHACQTTYGLYQAGRCFVLISSSQLSSLGIPQGILGNGSNIKAEATFTSGISPEIGMFSSYKTTSGSDTTYHSIMNYNFYVVALNTDEYLQLTQDGGQYARQQIAPSMPSTSMPVGGAPAGGRVIAGSGYKSKF
tara:strand:+ start:299 stop:1906 length:1608 start_codon:yes stop_codon:yes gene_type:complete